MSDENDSQGLVWTARLTLLCGRGASPRNIRTCWTVGWRGRRRGRELEEEREKMKKRKDLEKLREKVDLRTPTCTRTVQVE